MKFVTVRIFYYYYYYILKRIFDSFSLNTDFLHYKKFTRDYKPL